jgi:hypothetical protein
MADASVARLDEFPAGYSLPGCSSALPASALPAGVTMLSAQPNSGHLRSVTYVSEHVLPMSSVQRLTRRGLCLGRTPDPIRFEMRDSSNFEIV